MFSNVLVVIVKTILLAPKDYTAPKHKKHETFEHLNSNVSALLDDSKVVGHINFPHDR